MKIKAENKKAWWRMRFGFVGMLASLSAFLITLHVTPGMIDDLAQICMESFLGDALNLNTNQTMASIR
jgi:hypothetical protein